jgi:hypothetical protein
MHEEGMAESLVYDWAGMISAVRCMMTPGHSTIVRFACMVNTISAGRPFALTIVSGHHAHTHISLMGVDGA